MATLPDFDDLVHVKNMPQGCAWGVFDKDGHKDVYGCLNKITPEIVKQAAGEIRDGVSISLNWPINGIKTPGFQRKGLVHLVSDWYPVAGLHGFDDEVEFNTQCSSQWDSLCHYFHQESQSAYNGAKPTTEELTQDFGTADEDKKWPTLNHWHERGGLVGRGVLLDYKAYAQANNIEYSCFDNHTITVETLDEVAKSQGTVFRQGDILIVRTGFTEDLLGATAEEQDQMLGTHKAVGVEGNVKAAKWFWNHHFSAAAGDTLAFEVLPPLRENGEPGTIIELVLHQYFLSLFGLNIGELWDLKALSEYCARHKRYEFFFTSIGLNVPGNIGSPPNALAIF